MPIVFQQPSPMAPDIVSAAGAAEQWSKDAPMLARMYESAQSGQTQASIASAHNATQMNAAQLSESGRDSTSANMLQEHARQFDESRLPSQADAFHAQAAMAQQQQHAELQNWLGQQQMSHAEMLDYQRTQNSIGYINQAMQSGEIDPDTGKALLMQVRTKLDPMQRRVEMGKAKLEQAQTERAMHQMAQQEKIEQMNQAERAAYFKDRQVTATDPATGESHFGWINDKGNFEPFKSEKKEGADRASMAFSTWTKFEEHATNMAMKQQEAEMKAWEAKVKEATANEKEVPVFSTPDMQARIAANMKRLTGYSSYPEMLQGQQGMWRGHGQGPGQPDQTAPDQQGGTGQAPPPAPPSVVQQGNQPVDTQTLRPLQPFDWTKPETMAPAQKQWIGKLSGVRNEISGRKDLPEKQRWAAEDAVTDMKELLARHGAYSRMTPEEKTKYDAAERVVARLPRDPSESTGNANAGFGVGGY